MNYFDNRRTKASAESFNTKVKAFKAQYRGVRDVKFFCLDELKFFPNHNFWNDLKRLFVFKNN
ncbi:transposase [Tenacibaculum tangerinum]|uniref:Transposase n=1 Tax=Tenacibaculum tangerinum TaxID=3038772 RepID=A0ABY8L7R8_9FLAO|nr:transposase [Tenacibaculum tangerinum]WGH77116.1 transposase [Tenacibaculum tangerinum]